MKNFNICKKLIMETTLQEIKNTYAQEQGYEDWADLYRRVGYYDETKFFKHENAVIILAEKAALEKAAEKGCDSLELYNSEYNDLSKSITNPENLIL